MELAYSGSVDARGRPHGRGTQQADDGARFEGRFVAGQRSGAGCWHFADGATLKGTFADDALQGRGVYTHADGRTTVGIYRDGELDGQVTETDSDGFLLSRGQYRRGVPTGEWTIYYRDGGRLIGPVSATTGLITGAARYHYPDDSELRGTWQDGKMVRARYEPSTTAGLTVPVNRAVEYAYDESTGTVISTSPMLPDPYEQQRVLVAPSSIPGAGEGLFARRPLVKGEVVAFYNGVRLPPEVVDNRDWALNGNAITLGDDWVLDVPPPFDSTSHYIASLGHKANHAFDNSAEYELYDHPRFGPIKCLRTRRAIAAGAEVTVSYGYDDDLLDKLSLDMPMLEAPDWYRLLLREHRRAQQAAAAAT